MNETWKPRLPKAHPYCAICGERVTAPPFVASKPRKGSPIYIHTACFAQEQRERKENKNEQ